MFLFLVGLAAKYFFLFFSYTGCLCGVGVLVFAMPVSPAKKYWSMSQIVEVTVVMSIFDKGFSYEDFEFAKMNGYSEVDNIETYEDLLEIRESYYLGGFDLDDSYEFNMESY